MIFVLKNWAAKIYKKSHIEHGPTHGKTISKITINIWFRFKHQEMF